VHLSRSAAAWLANAAPENIALAIELGIPAASAVIESRSAASAAISRATQIVESMLGSVSEIRRSEPTPEPVLAPPVVSAVMSSYAKGSLGEVAVSQALSEEFGDVKVTSRDVMSGDMSIYIHGAKILVEVKNYATGVPAREVDKFHRDVEATASAAGLFISLGGAQISTITRGFELAYKFCGSRVIPCAYVVAGDPKQIIVAARMLVRAISLKQEPNTGKLAEAHDGLAALSRARTELQLGLGEITSRMVGFSSGVAAAEAKLRDSFEDARQTITAEVSTAESIILKLSRAEIMSTYTPVQRGILEEVVKIINDSRHGVAADTWCVSERAITDNVTGVSIKFLRGHTTAYIPRSAISRESILSGLQELGESFRVAKQVEVILDVRGLDWCRRTFYCGQKSTDAVSERQ
jgi:hypothetical protein